VAGADRELAAYRELSHAGLIKQRATLCITWTPGDEQSERAIRLRNLYAGPRVSPSCVKIFLDGVPTDSHTAAMLAPYVEADAPRKDEAAPPGCCWSGGRFWTPRSRRPHGPDREVCGRRRGRARGAQRDRRGAQGERLQAGAGVGHCTFVDPADAACAGTGRRVRGCPYLWGPSPIHDSIIAAIGPQRIARVAGARDAGRRALVVPGSDWSVVESVSPWIDGTRS
jgi:hypothetical protein